MAKQQNIWKFRVASSPQYGGGHMMRCVALAKEMGEHGVVRFLLDQDSAPEWPQFLNTLGYYASINHENKDYVSDVLIIDGYQFGREDWEFFRSKTKLLVIIADKVNNYAPADLVILPSVNSWSKGLGSEFLAGCAYSLVDPIHCCRSTNEYDGRADRLLVSCGMLDSKNITAHVLQALNEIEYKGEVVVTLGAQSKNLMQLSKIASRAKYKFRLVKGQFDTYCQIEESNFVIGAGGQGLLERMAIGRPSLTIVASNNQKDQARYMGEHGATEVIEVHDLAKLSETIALRLHKLLDNRQLLKTMANIGACLVDGNGVNRVTNKILGML
jgi:spore coat polysaccharide biosynthesis predicted glycosyltransferase SpsG